MASVTFIDTNVLAYLHDGSQPEKRAAASRTLSSVESAVISTQVLIELFSVLTRELGIPAHDAQRQVQDLMELRVVPADAALVRAAINLSIVSAITHWDAMIVAAAARAGCDVLLTEDLTHGQVISGVRVVNPFEGG